MLERFPKWYEEFHCLAGDCPHTCCAAWEVVLDEETEERYYAVPGELGERLRSAMVTDEDGDACFALDGGRCPFLDRDNLCVIHKELGEEATSVTCREHPRFIEDYGLFRELNLIASCPEANRLLFARPFALEEREVEEEPEEADNWILYFLEVRQKLLAILAEEERPLRQRLEDLIRLALVCHEAMADGCSDVMVAMEPEDCCQLEPGEGSGVFPGALDFLAGLERLEEDWGELLERAKTARPQPGHDGELTKVAEYFIYRHFLKVINDFNLLGRVEQCVLLTLAAERLGPVCGGIPEALRRISCEIEHSDENLDALLKGCRKEPCLGWKAILREFA